MPESPKPPLHAFVQLAYGFGGKSWKERWENGSILGINENQAYGYHRAAAPDVEIVYSEDAPETRLTRLVRLGVRFLLGFDLVHIWRNREPLLKADVVWTHTESQTLAVLTLFRLIRPIRRPRLIGQVIWLVDRWQRQPRLRRFLFKHLLRSLDVMTLHSSLNCEDARQLFPGLRVEQVFFGIRIDEMRAPFPPKSASPTRLISLGNDEHRDWETLVRAVSSLPQTSLQIASRNPLAVKACQNVHNAEVFQAKTNDELLAFYESAEIVVVSLTPNRHVSGLTVVQEALIRGCAVIATDTGGLRDYFNDDMLCYVPPHDPDALRAAITALQTSPEKRQSMVVAGQRQLKSRINSVDYARRHVSLSRELLARVPNMPLPDRPKVVIGIATSGRPEILANLIDLLKNQSWQPDRIIISYARPTDIEALPPADRQDSRIEFITGLQGSAIQRNVILDHLTNEDFILFLDDDFFPHHDYIEEMVHAFRQDSSILGLTGRLLADGAQGPGLSVKEAYRLNAAHKSDIRREIKDVFNTYGCNMAFRIQALKHLKTRFDEKLPLYAWYEDMDFSRSLLPFGRIVKAEAAVGVHLGNKTGKTSGLRFGYSQIVNPIYLARKGTYPWDHALKSAGRHLLVNLMKSLRPEPYVDRRGRAQGNLIGLYDLLRGRVTPGRASNLTPGKTTS